MPLKIGFDASSTIGPRLGIGRTALSLLRALVALEDGDLELQMLLASFWRRPTAEHLALAQSGVGLVRVKRSRHRLARSWAMGTGPAIQSFMGQDLSVVFSPHGIPAMSENIPSAVLVPTLQLPGADPQHNAPWLTAQEIDSWKRRVNASPLVLAPTRSLCARIKEAIPDAADRVRHLPLGLDDAAFFVENERLVESTRQHWGIPTSSYLLAVSGHGKEDRAELLIDTYSRLREREQATPHLVVLGWKGKAPSVLRARRDLHRAVHVIPHIPDAQMSAILTGAAATILTGDNDGWPHALLEAQACGSPVVASANSSNREVAGESALLLESSEASDWVAAVETVGFDQATHDAWKDKGLQNARRYRWENTASALIQMLRGL